MEESADGADAPFIVGVTGRLMILTVRFPRLRDEGRPR